MSPRREPGWSEPMLEDHDAEFLSVHKRYPLDDGARALAGQAVEAGADAAALREVLAMCGYLVPEEEKPARVDGRTLRWQNRNS